MLAEDRGKLSKLCLHQLEAKEKDHFRRLISKMFFINNNKLAFHNKHTVFSPPVEEGVNACIGATAAKKATALKKLVNAIVDALKER